MEKETAPAGLSSAPSKLVDAAGMRWLTPDNAVFSRTPGGLLSVAANGETHPVVYLHCSFPHSRERSYLSVRTAEGKEIGMVSSMDDFPPETVALLEEQVRLRYHAPVITKVIGVREEFGYAYWETETTAGACRFTIRTGGSHVKPVAGDKLVITDVDGNRWTIPHFSGLSEREYRLVEMCM